MLLKLYLIIFTEAQYASHLKKHIIPLKYDNHKPSGWLGIMINNLLYYDVRTEQSLMDNFSEIKKAVDEILYSEWNYLGKFPSGRWLIFLTVFFFNIVEANNWVNYHTSFILYERFRKWLKLPQLQLNWASTVGESRG